MRANAPLLDGVPEIMPLALVRMTPVGNAPCEMLHVYGAVPPVALNCSEYAEPVVPAGSVEV